ncbi:MAG: hypothetical protein QOE77_4231 [Blastocatellia bacterium]|nr:hypothetical protein [Blastocatellia bacterium]
MAAAQHARSIVDFVLELSQNPDKAAEYKADPTAYMTSRGMDADLQQEILQAQESALASHTTRYDDGGEVAGTGGDSGGGGSTVIVAVVVVVVA